MARAEWFRKSAAHDALIRERFGAAVEAALEGRLGPDWAAAPLARILLLDQCTRNVFRDTPRAFAGDAQALALARQMTASGADRALHPLQRGFVYLPFEHAEDLAAQEEGLRHFQALAASDPAGADALDWAQRHAAIVRRFGRFPHRNLVLGRVSSAEELEFLTQPGSRF